MRSAGTVRRLHSIQCSEPSFARQRVVMRRAPAASGVARVAAAIAACSSAGAKSKIEAPSSSSARQPRRLVHSRLTRWMRPRKSTVPSMSPDRSKKRVLSSCRRRWSVMSRAMPSDPIGWPAASRNGLFVTERTYGRSPKRPAIS